MIIKKFLTIAILLSVWGTLFSQEKETSTNTEIKYPEKQKGRQTWEYIVNTPGYICMLPFWALDAALVPVSYAITETKIIEKTADLLTSDDGKRGVFPVFESRTGAGINFYQKDLISQGSELSITTTTWASARQSFQLYLNNLNLGGPFRTSMSALYYNYTDETFFGIGNDLPYENEADFELKQYQTNISIGLEMGRYNALTINSGFEQNQVSESNEEKNKDEKLLSEIYGKYNNNHVPIYSLFDKVRLVHSELQVSHDSRDTIGNPTKGWKLSLRGGLFKQSDGSNYGFYRGIADVTKYVHLFHNRVFVFRAAGQITTSFNDGKIPFYYLSELGERSTIRGYERGRYREKDKVLGSVEYRFPILKRYRTGREAGSLDMVLFVDSGKVSPDITDNFTDNFHTAYGFGLRVYNSKALMMQFYSGFSDDGVRLYFVLN